MHLKTIFKILSVVFLFVLAFNFIYSEIIEQIEGKTECEPAHDYCKLVEAASVKSLSSNNIDKECCKIIYFLCQNYQNQTEGCKSIYGKHQNFSFYHLEPTPIYLFNKFFLI